MFSHNKLQAYLDIHRATRVGEKGSSKTRRVLPAQTKKEEVSTRHHHQKEKIEWVCTVLINIQCELIYLCKNSVKSAENPQKINQIHIYLKLKKHNLKK